MSKSLVFILLAQLSFFSNAFATETSKAEITFIGNEGFMIANHDKIILIDALYDNTGGSNGIKNVDESISNLIMSNQEPFTNCNLYFITHSHADHYNQTMVSSFLKNNPQSIMVADSSLTKIFKATFKNQIFSATPARYEHIDTILNGISFAVYNLKHNSQVKIYNVGYWVDIDGLKIFHGGDNILEDSTEYLNSNLLSHQVDIAFLNHNGFLKSTVNSEFIKNHLKPRYIVLMHIPENQLSSVKEKVSKLDNSYPPIFVFNDSMEKINVNDIATISRLQLEKKKTQCIYPNPTNKYIWFNQNLSTNMKIQIFDLQGKLLYDVPSETNPVDISFLPKGFYITKLFNSETVITQKLIKE